MDLLNLAAEERVNLADLSFALTDSIIGQHAELAQGLFLSPTAAQAAAIVSGFVPMAAAAGGPVVVGSSSTPNSAFLCRLAADGTLRPAELVYGGTSSVAIDISTFPSNTYGIYVRGNRTPQTVQNRAFWSGVDASEYAQLTPTRLTVSWEVRIETASPGAEWLRIGQAQVTAAQSGGQGATVVVTDQRPLLFEGTSGAGYAPTWGTAADRSARQGATITSLATMVDALKQCIVDIKGRGLATWYQPNISGMQVGSAFGLANSPTANQLAVGDGGLYLSLAAGVPAIAFDGTNDFLQLNRSTGVFSHWRGGQPNFSMYPDGSTVFGPGVQAGYFTVIQPAVAAAYTLCARTGIPSQPASIGIASVNTQSAFLEMGQGYGQAMSQMRTSWSGQPTVTLSVGGAGFLSATNLGGYNIGLALGGGTGNSSVSISSQMTYFGRQVLYNMMPVCGGVLTANNVTVNGDGTTSGGSYSITQFSGPPGSSASAQLNRTGNQTNTAYGPTMDITFSNMSVPNNAVVVITAQSNTTSGGRCLGVSYFQSGNTISVLMRNDNNEVAIQGFSFALFFNS